MSVHYEFIREIIYLNTGTVRPHDFLVKDFIYFQNHFLVFITTFYFKENFYTDNLFFHSFLSTKT